MSRSPISLALTAAAVVEAIQGTLDSTIEQYLATVALGVSFVVAVWIIFLGRPALQRRFSDEVVDIARTLTIMAVALVSALVFVTIWGVEGRVQDALAELMPGNPGGTALVVFIAFLVILGTYALSRVTKRVVRHWSETGRISPHQRELAHHAIQIVLFLVAVAFIVALFNQNPRDLFLGAGVLGIVLGFAARKTLSDVLSGFVILFGRPFEAGDWVAIGDRQGIVTEITVFNTQVRTFNEEHVLVPNDRVTDRELINYSKTDRLRIETEVGVDYDTDVAAAATIAKETMEACEEVAATPSPDVVLESFGESAIRLQLRYWIDRPTIQRKLSARNEVIDEVKTAFEREGIKIPYPQRELMGREATDGLRIASDGDATVGEEVERAVRRVNSDSTTVEEPVEDRYREPDEAADVDGPSNLVEEETEVRTDAREPFQDVGGDGDVTEPVEDEYGDDGGNRDGDDDVRSTDADDRDDDRVDDHDDDGSTDDGAFDDCEDHADVESEDADEQR